MRRTPPTTPAGIITLHKPTGITSAKALYRVRTITGVRKSGHAGTLDPAADGVLVLCLGRATKLVESIMDQPKVYRAAARLDVTSDSFDSDSPHISVETGALPTSEQIHTTLSSFEGTINQVPPAVSAVKIGGKPAYRLARAGRPVKLQPRPVTIYWLNPIRYDWPVFEFEMCCGRGTYVRALVRDLGARLNTGGCLTALTRTTVGPFTLDRAATLKDLEAARDPLLCMMPVERAATLLAARPIRIPPKP